MGMPCQVNSILKLSLQAGYPDSLVKNQRYRAKKSGYRIIPMDVPIALVDEHWMAYSDVKIHRLTFQSEPKNQHH